MRSGRRSGLAALGGRWRAVLAATGLASFVGCGACESLMESGVPPADPAAPTASDSEGEGAVALAPVPARPDPDAGGALPPELVDPPLEIHDGLPSDVPRPADATPVSQSVLPSGDYLAGFDSAAPPHTVFLRMQEDLAADGWLVEHALEGDQQRVIRASKGQRRVHALILEHQGGTRAAIRATLD